MDNPGIPLWLIKVQINMKRIVLILFILQVLQPLFLKAQKTVAEATKPILKAGVYKVDITPPMRIPLGGYANRSGAATGIHAPLYASVIVFVDGETKIAIVTLDIIQVKYNEGQQIYRAIERETGIKENNILINASHTHGSPWLETDSCYKYEVVEKVAGAVKVAVSNLCPG